MTQYAAALVYAVSFLIVFRQRTHYALFLLLVAVAIGAVNLTLAPAVWLVVEFVDFARSLLRAPKVRHGG